MASATVEMPQQPLPDTSTAMHQPQLNCASDVKAEVPPPQRPRPWSFHRSLRNAVDASERRRQEEERQQQQQQRHQERRRNRSRSASPRAAARDEDGRIGYFRRRLSQTSSASDSGMSTASQARIVDGMHAAEEQGEGQVHGVNGKTTRRNRRRSRIRTDGGPYATCSPLGVTTTHTTKTANGHGSATAVAGRTIDETSHCLATPAVPAWAATVRSALRAVRQAEDSLVQARLALVHVLECGAPSPSSSAARFNSVRGSTMGGATITSGALLATPSPSPLQSFASDSQSRMGQTPADSSTDEESGAAAAAAGVLQDAQALVAEPRRHRNRRSQRRASLNLHGDGSSLQSDGPLRATPNTSTRGSRRHASVDESMTGKAHGRGAWHDPKRSEVREGPGSLTHFSRTCPNGSQERASAEWSARAPIQEGDEVGGGEDGIVETVMEGEGIARRRVRAFSSQSTSMKKLGTMADSTTLSSAMGEERDDEDDANLGVPTPRRMTEEDRLARMSRTSLLSYRESTNADGHDYKDPDAPPMPPIPPQLPSSPVTQQTGGSFTLGSTPDHSIHRYPDRGRYAEGHLQPCTPETSGARLALSAGPTPDSTQALAALIGEEMAAHISESRRTEPATTAGVQLQLDASPTLASVVAAAAVAAGRSRSSLSASMGMSLAERRASLEAAAPPTRYRHQAAASDGQVHLDLSRSLHSADVPPRYHRPHRDRQLLHRQHHRPYDSPASPGGEEGTPASAEAIRTTIAPHSSPLVRSHWSSATSSFNVSDSTAGFQLRSDARDLRASDVSRCPTASSSALLYNVSHSANSLPSSTGDGGGGGGNGLGVEETIAEEKSEGESDDQHDHVLDAAAAREEATSSGRVKPAAGDIDDEPNEVLREQNCAAETPRRDDDDDDEDRGYDSSSVYSQLSPTSLRPPCPDVHSARPTASALAAKRKSIISYVSNRSHDETESRALRLGADALGVTALPKKLSWSAGERRPGSLPPPPRTETKDEEGEALESWIDPPTAAALTFGTIHSSSPTANPNVSSPIVQNHSHGQVTEPRALQSPVRISPVPTTRAGDVGQDCFEQTLDLATAFSQPRHAPRPPFGAAATATMSADSAVGGSGRAGAHTLATSSVSSTTSSQQKLFPAMQNIPLSTSKSFIVSPGRTSGSSGSRDAGAGSGSSTNHGSSGRASARGSTSNQSGASNNPNGHGTHSRGSWLSRKLLRATASILPPTSTASTSPSDQHAEGGAFLAKLRGHVSSSPDKRISHNTSSSAATPKSRIVSSISPLATCMSNQSLSSPPAPTHPRQSKAQQVPNGDPFASPPRRSTKPASLVPSPPLFVLAPQTPAVVEVATSVSEYIEVPSITSDAGGRKGSTASPHHVSSSIGSCDAPSESCPRAPANPEAIEAATTAAATAATAAAAEMAQPPEPTPSSRIAATATGRATEVAAAKGLKVDVQESRRAAPSSKGEETQDFDEERTPMPFPTRLSCISGATSPPQNRRGVNDWTLSVYDAVTSLPPSPPAAGGSGAQDESRPAPSHAQDKREDVTQSAGVPRPGAAATSEDRPERSDGQSPSHWSPSTEETSTRSSLTREGHHSRHPSHATNPSLSHIADGDGGGGGVVGGGDSPAQASIAASRRLQQAMGSLTWQGQITAGKVQDAGLDGNFSNRVVQQGHESAHSSRALRLGSRGTTASAATLSSGAEGDDYEDYMTASMAASITSSRDGWPRREHSPVGAGQAKNAWRSDGEEETASPQRLGRAFLERVGSAPANAVLGGDETAGKAQAPTVEERSRFVDLWPTRAGSSPGSPHDATLLGTGIYSLAPTPHDVQLEATTPIRPMMRLGNDAEESVDSRRRETLRPAAMLEAVALFAPRRSSEADVGDAAGVEAADESDRLKHSDGLVGDAQSLRSQTSSTAARGEERSIASPAGEAERRREDLQCEQALPPSPAAIRGESRGNETLPTKAVSRQSPRVPPTMLPSATRSPCREPSCSFLDSAVTPTSEAPPFSMASGGQSGAARSDRAPHLTLSSPSGIVRSSVLSMASTATASSVEEGGLAEAKDESVASLVDPFVHVHAPRLSATASRGTATLLRSLGSTAKFASRVLRGSSGGAAAPAAAETPTTIHSAADATELAVVSSGSSGPDGPRGRDAAVEGHGPSPLPSTSQAGVAGVEADVGVAQVEMRSSLPSCASSASSSSSSRTPCDQAAVATTSAHTRGGVGGSVSRVADDDGAVDVDPSAEPSLSWRRAPLRQECASANEAEADGGGIRGDFEECGGAGPVELPPLNLSKLSLLDESESSLLSYDVSSASFDAAAGLRSVHSSLVPRRGRPDEATGSAMAESDGQQPLEGGQELLEDEVLRSKTQPRAHVNPLDAAGATLRVRVVGPPRTTDARGGEEEAEPGQAGRGWLVTPFDDATAAKRDPTTPTTPTASTPKSSCPSPAATDAAPSPWGHKSSFRKWVREQSLKRGYEMTAASGGGGGGGSGGADV